MNVLIKAIRIILGATIARVYVYITIPFRGWSRSYVYNGVLQWEKHNWLKRLWERNPTWYEASSGWLLEDIHAVGRYGEVRYRKVNKVVFWLVVIFVWMWLDDDANHDTTDLGFCFDNVFKMRKSKKSLFLSFGPDFIIVLVLAYYSMSAGVIYLAFVFVLMASFVYRVKKIDWLQVDQGLGLFSNWNDANIKFGNAFDLGDVRAEYPFFDWALTYPWNTRNSVMNLGYLFNY